MDLPVDGLPDRLKISMKTGIYENSLNRNTQSSFLVDPPHTLYSLRFPTDLSPYQALCAYPAQYQLHYRRSIQGVAFYQI